MLGITAPFYALFVSVLWKNAVAKYEDPLLSTSHFLVYYLLFLPAVFLLLGTKPKYNPAFLYEALRWKAFKKFLANFTLLKEAPIDIHKVWDRYMVYATALGVADKFMRNVEKLAQEGLIRDIEHPSWYIGTGHSSGDGLSTTSVASGISSLASALAGPTGFGGGFSGGGGSSGGGSGGGGGSSGAS